MFPQRTRLTVGLAVLVALVIAAIVVGGPAALVMGPVLLAALPFLVGLYPGERLLHRLARARRVRASGAPAARAPRAPRTLGRRLTPLASHGASRAPPALA